MSEWLTVIVLGIIEGVTEFLPVSSTGHLLLAEHWLPKQSDLFNIQIQSGAVIAVLVIFMGRVRKLALEWRDASTRDYLAKLLLAFFITGAGGLVLKKLSFKLPETAQPVAWATLIGGVVILGLEKWLKNRPVKDDITWKIAAAAGVAQLVAAVFPGTSRSGITILTGLALGVSRPAATEFSFLLGIPTLVAAGLLQTVSALRHPPVEPVSWSMIGLGTLVSAVTAFLVVKWLLRFVQSHTFIGFGWYRIVLGIMILFMI